MVPIRVATVAARPATSTPPTMRPISGAWSEASARATDTRTPTARRSRSSRLTVTVRALQRPAHHGGGGDGAREVQREHDGHPDDKADDDGERGPEQAASGQRLRQPG